MNSTQSNKRKLNMDNMLATQIHTLTIPKEKNLHNLDDLKLLDEMKFIYGSVRFNYEFDGTRYKKTKPEFKDKTWKNQNKSFYDASYNGIYIKTGQISNCFVIDIDDMTKREARFIYDNCYEKCNLIVKTKKGYHFYFNFDPELNTSKSLQQMGFDIRSDGGIIYAPPCYYKDENNEIMRYEFVKKAKHLNDMDKTVKKYILDLITKPVKDKKLIVQHTKKIVKQKEINDTVIEESIVKKLIDGLSVDRAIEYSDWIYAGIALKNSGYPVELWDYFSKKSPKYDYNCNYDFYHRLFDGNYNENNKLTISTLWFWLKKDNEKLFWELQKEVAMEKYNETVDDDDDDFDIDKCIKYDDKIMIELFQKDMELLGFDQYDDYLSKTRSFKYFNRFHFFIKELKTYYLINYKTKNVKLMVLGQELCNIYKHLNIKINGKRYFFINFYDTCYEKKYMKNLILYLMTQIIVLMTFSIYSRDSNTILRKLSLIIN